MAWALCLPPPALCRAQRYLLSASPLLLRQEEVLSPGEKGRLRPATRRSPAPWDHIWCHDSRLIQGPQDPNDERVLSQAPPSLSSPDRDIWIQRCQHAGLLPRAPIMLMLIYRSDGWNISLKNWQGDCNRVCLMAEPSISMHLLASLKVRSFLFFIS